MFCARRIFVAFSVWCTLGHTRSNLGIICQRKLLWLGFDSYFDGRHRVTSLEFRTIIEPIFGQVNFLILILASLNSTLIFNVSGLTISCRSNRTKRRKERGSEEEARGVQDK